MAAAVSGGTVVLSGLHEEVGPIPAAEVIRREIVVRGSFCYTPADFAAGLTLLEQGAIRLDPWVVVDALASGGAWFDRMVSGAVPAAKVLLRP